MLKKKVEYDLKSGRVKVVYYKPVVGGWKRYYAKTVPRAVERKHPKEVARLKKKAEHEKALREGRLPAPKVPTVTITEYKTVPSKKVGVPDTAKVRIITRPAHPKEIRSAPWTPPIHYPKRRKASAKKVQKPVRVQISRMIKQKEPTEPPSIVSRESVPELRSEPPSIVSRESVPELSSKFELVAPEGKLEIRSSPSEGKWEPAYSPTERTILHAQELQRRGKILGARAGMTIAGVFEEAELMMGRQPFTSESAMRIAYSEPTFLLGKGYALWVETEAIGKVVGAGLQKAMKIPAVKRGLPLMKKLGFVEEKKMVKEFIEAEKIELKQVAKGKMVRIAKFKPKFVERQLMPKEKIVIPKKVRFAKVKVSHTAVKPVGKDKMFVLRFTESSERLVDAWKTTIPEKTAAQFIYSEKIPDVKALHVGKEIIIPVKSPPKIKFPKRGVRIRGISKHTPWKLEGKVKPPKLKTQTKMLLKQVWGSGKPAGTKIVDSMRQISKMRIRVPYKISIRQKINIPKMFYPSIVPVVRNGRIPRQVEERKTISSPIKPEVRRKILSESTIDKWLKIPEKQKVQKDFTELFTRKMRKQTEPQKQFRKQFQEQLKEEFKDEFREQFRDKFQDTEINAEPPTPPIFRIGLLKSRKGRKKKKKKKLEGYRLIKNPVGVWGKAKIRRLW